MHDENVVRMNWLYSNAVSGVKLLVAREDAEPAARVLGEVERSTDANPHLLYGELPCPSCSSGRTECVIKGRKPAFLTWLLAGIPLWRPRAVWSCATCGHEWSPDGTTEVPIP